MQDLLYAGITLASILIFAQSTHTLYLALYTWNQPPSHSTDPAHFLSPRLSFTVMLPARHEEDVIGATIERVARAHYPSHLIQILVICSEDDEGTISQAQKKIRQLWRARARQCLHRGIP